MCKTEVDYYPHASEYVSDCSRNVEKIFWYLCLFTLVYVSNCYKTQRMCKKAVDTCSFLLNCVDNCCKQEKEWWRNGWKTCF